MHVCAHEVRGQHCVPSYTDTWMLSISLPPIPHPLTPPMFPSPLGSSLIIVATHIHVIILVRVSTVIKHHNQKQLGEPTVPHHHPSLRQVRAGAQTVQEPGGRLKRRPRGLRLPGLLTVTYCWLSTAPGTTSLGTAPPTVGWTSYISC